MSKTNITLSDFEAMTPEEVNNLSPEDLARLTEEKQISDQDQADAAEAVEIKKKYAAKAPNGVFCLRVEDAKAWLKNIDRKLVSMVSMTAGHDPIEAAEVILENCWLEGDERIKTDDGYFFGAMTQLQALRAMKAAQIKKY